MIEDELRLAQAQLHLGRARAARLVAVAREALVAGCDEQALLDLAVLDPYAPVADATPLFQRVLDAFGLPPIDDEAALELVFWPTARRIANEIVDGRRPPLAGARALDSLFDEFGQTEKFHEWCYVVSMMDPGVATQASLAKLERHVIDLARELLQR